MVLRVEGGVECRHNARRERGSHVEPQEVEVKSHQTFFFSQESVEREQEAPTMFLHQQADRPITRTTVRKRVL